MEGTPQPAAPTRRTPWATRLLLVAAAVIPLVALANSWFYYDDFWNISVAKDLGFGYRQLTHDVLGHFYPGYNMVFWAVGASGTLAYPIACALIGVGFASIGWLAYRAAIRMGASTEGAFAVSAATLLNGTWATVLLWFSAVTNSIPAALFELGALLCAMRWVRRRRRVDALAVGLCVAGALAFYETAVFALLPIAATVILANTTGSWRARLRSIRSWWPLAISFLVPVAIDGLIFVLGPFGNAFDPPPPVLTAARFAARGVGDGGAAGVAGFHPEVIDLFASQTLTLVVSWLAIIAVCAWAGRRWGRFVVVAPLVWAVTVFFREGLVGWSRLSTLGWGAAHDARYLADLSWVLPMLLCAVACGARLNRTATAEAGPSDTSLGAVEVGGTDDHPNIMRDPSSVPAVAPLPSVPPASASRTSASRAPGARAAGTTTLGLSLILTVVLGAQLTIAHGQAPSKITNTWRTAFGDSYAKLQKTGEPFGVLDTLAPASVLGPQFGFYTHLSRTLTASYGDIPFNEPTLPLYAPDFGGALIPAVLTPAAQLKVAEGRTAGTGAVDVFQSPDGTCVTPRGASAIWWVPLTAPLPPQFWVFRFDLGYGSNAPSVGLLAQNGGYVAFQAPIDWNRSKVLATSNFFGGNEIGFEVKAEQTLCLRSGEILKLEPPG